MEKRSPLPAPLRPGPAAGRGSPTDGPPPLPRRGESPLFPPPALANPSPFASRCSGRVGGWCCASPPRWQVRGGPVLCVCVCGGGKAGAGASLRPPPGDRAWGPAGRELAGLPSRVAAAGEHPRRGSPQAVAALSFLFYFIF